MLLGRVVGPVLGLLSREPDQTNLNWLVQSGPQRPQSPSAGPTTFPNSEPRGRPICSIK